MTTEARFNLIEKRLEEGEIRFERIEAIQKKQYEGTMRLEAKLTNYIRDQGRRHAEVLGTIEGLKNYRRKLPTYPDFDDKDANELTPVESVDLLRERARVLRSRSKRSDRMMKAGIPGAIVIAVPVWELIKILVAHLR